MAKQGLTEEAKESALDPRGNLLKKGEEARFVLIWLHGDPKGDNHTHIVPTDDVIDYKPVEDPINHYYVIWDNDGQLEKKEAQIMAVAATEHELEKLRTEKKVIDADGVEKPFRMKFITTKRLSGAKTSIMHRNQNFENHKSKSPKNRRLSALSKNVKNFVKAKKAKNRKAAQRNGRKAGLKIQKPKKPNTTVTDDEDYIVRKVDNFQSLEMDTEPEREIDEEIEEKIDKEFESNIEKDTDVEIFNDESLPVAHPVVGNVQLKNTREIADGRNDVVGDKEKIVTDSTDAEETIRILRNKNGLLESQRDFFFKKCERLSAELETLKTKKNDIIVPARIVSGKRVKGNKRKPAGYYSEKQKAKWASQEKRGRKDPWFYIDRFTKDKIHMLHLRYNRSVIKHSYERSRKKKPSKFLAELLELLYGNKSNIAVRAFSPNSCKEPGRLPMTPKMVACAQEEYFEKIDDDVKMELLTEEEAHTLKTEFGDKVQNKIQNCRKAVRNAAEDEEESDGCNDGDSPYEARAPWFKAETVDDKDNDSPNKSIGSCTPLSNSSDQARRLRVLTKSKKDTVRTELIEGTKKRQASGGCLLGLDYSKSYMSQSESEKIAPARKKAKKCIDDSDDDVRQSEGSSVGDDYRNENRSVNNEGDKEREDSISRHSMKSRNKINHSPTPEILQKPEEGSRSQVSRFGASNHNSKKIESLKNDQSDTNSDNSDTDETVSPSQMSPKRWGVEGASENSDTDKIESASLVKPKHSTVENARKNFVIPETDPDPEYEPRSTPRDGEKANRKRNEKKWPSKLPVHVESWESPSLLSRNDKHNSGWISTRSK